MKNTLIATRISGDCWRFLDPIFPEKNTFNSLTDTLEAYFQKTQYKGDFLLSPSTSKLYIIEEVVKPKKTFNIYGDKD